MATQVGETKLVNELVISWEALPKDFQLEDEPVENTDQPLLAGALRESLEISGFIQPQMLMASNFGLCATHGKAQKKPEQVIGCAGGRGQEICYLGQWK
jgi:hypothetical protein